MRYLVRVFLTAVIVVAVGETAKMNKLWGAIIASLPLTSLLAISWMYYDTGDKKAVAELSESILYMVIPSLTLFIVLPAMLRREFSFTLSILASSGLTAVVYAAVTTWLTRN